jgi:hypothetical protein
MAKSIYAIEPDPEKLLALSPREIAGIIMEHLNSGDMHEKEKINRGNFSNQHSFEQYPYDQREKILKRLMEGWQWAESNGLLTPKPGNAGNQGWVFISNTGEQIKSRADMDRLFPEERNGGPQSSASAGDAASLTETDDEVGSSAEDQTALFELQNSSQRQYADGLDKLRRDIAAEEKDILNDVWNEFRKNSRAMPTHLLNERHTRQVVSEALNRLGKRLIVETLNQMKTCTITFLGALLTDSGEAGESLLAGWLAYARALYRSNQTIETIKSDRIEKALKLTRDQSQALKSLLTLSPFRGSMGSDHEIWDATLAPDIIDQIYDEDDLRGYVRRTALAGAKGNLSLVAENLRRALPEQAQEETNEPVSIRSSSISDQPSAKDILGFGPYVAAIKAFLIDDDTKAPLTLSIEGKWGSGKSSFMLQLEQSLQQAGRITVTFNRVLSVSRQ